MPILQVSLSKEIQTPENTHINPAESFAKQVNIEPELVTVYTQSIRDCYGNRYEAVAHLFLPNLWSPGKVGQMLEAAATLIESYWKVPKRKTIIMVQQLSSGHVFDRGRLESW